MFTIRPTDEAKWNATTWEKDPTCLPSSPTTLTKERVPGKNQSKHDEANQNIRNKNNKPVSNIIVHHDLGAEELPGRPQTQVVHVEAGCEIFLDYVATIPFWEQEVESTVQKEIPRPTHRACSGDHPGSVAHADVRLRRGGAIVNYVKDTCTLSRTRDLPVPTQL